MVLSKSEDINERTSSRLNCRIVIPPAGQVGSLCLLAWESLGIIIITVS